MPRGRARHSPAALACAVVLAVAVLAGPYAAPADAAARPAGIPATGTGCGSTVGKVTLDTTYDPATGRYLLADTRRGDHRTYDLAGATTGTGTLVTDDDNVWCEGGPQAAAVDAHYANAVVWDYYLTVHGRKGGVRPDGRGGCSRVHYGDHYQNVIWRDSCLAYGDGADPAWPPTRIDAAGYMLTQVLVAATADLSPYSGESAALAVATSDIFGVSAEFFADNAADPGDYLVAERTGPDGTLTAARHLDRPSKDGHAKDSWYPGIGSTFPRDAAGPAEHFFYLLSEGSGPKVIGGVAYDSPTHDGRPVAGIGRAAAERIWFRALTVYMTSTTNYKAARAATLRAAADLYGTGGAPYRAVEAAWTAVNVV
ncbi:M4 family metallopeptidase [Streptomyces sp. HU2014]|uniref:M4 family metallopeptidase n=1 Tax=Streptomyces sp. HU2014 TaxID=2939414 RepID=UPI00200DF3F2|nr:M4 family metallopeptidase [Streptomyces sp. HU2014]UQI45098.1 M4 family metallopeptidase [Streptomyces sp. HU2014]